MPSFVAARSATESTPVSPLPTWSAPVAPSPMSAPRPKRAFCAVDEQKALTDTAKSVSVRAWACEIRPVDSITSTAGTSMLKQVKTAVVQKMRVLKLRWWPTSVITTAVTTSTPVEMTGK